MTDGWPSWDSHNLQPKYKIPQQHPGSSQYAVPSWERRFCTSVCSIPWGKICVAKASLSAYKSIALWDDSAALEAFQNAKARYWAHINRLPYDIPLPDPNLYIDIVNHKAVIDPKLVEDLEKQPQPPVLDDNDRDSNGLDSCIFENKPIPNDSTVEYCSVNWDKFVENHLPGNGDSHNAWKQGTDGWGDSWNSHAGGWCDTNNSWNMGRHELQGQPWSSLNNEQSWRNNRKRKGERSDSYISKSRCMNGFRPYKNSWSNRMERNMG